MSARSDGDDWVFDTIKPSTVRQPITKHTIKRRKLSRIPSGSSSDEGIADAAAAMQRLELQTGGPLSGSTSSPGYPSKRSSTIQTPQHYDGVSTQRRKVSAGTARKISMATPTARRVSRNVSGAAPTARRVSGQSKQPLGLDMSFGNGTSTVRQFRRVSSAQRKAPIMPAQPLPPLNIAEDTPPESDAENQPPQSRDMKPPVIAASKEAMLGRRAYSKHIDAALQQTYAQTADTRKRDALSRVAEAWSALDEADPEGELLLLKNIFDRIQSDPKLAAAIMPQQIVNAQLASLRIPKSTPSKKTAMVTERDFAAGAGATGSIGKGKLQGKGSVRLSTPASSPTKLAAASPSRDGTPKLVMAPQNPHLKSLRRKQSALQLAEEKRCEDRKLEEKMPGRLEAGDEHVGMLADVLYGRWTEGLRSRWPAA